MQSLLFVTGTRADFGKLEPLATAARKAGFKVSFFVTGMHLMARYGLTKLEVQKTPDIVSYEFMNQRAGDPQDTILAKTVLGFSDFVAEQKPDLVIVHGDRVEALACALVCATNYVRCAHIEGGEVSGTIDEIFRHCNSKLANYHFVSSPSAAKRVQALGEPSESIHVIGSPELDFHSQDSGVSLAEVKTRYDIAFEDYGICVFHPVTSEADQMETQARALYGELEASKRNFVLILPNNDPGSEAIFEVINALPQQQFRAIPSMRFAHFSELMKNASGMVGNSSAGVREAPFLGVPSLDVGTRQTNRAQAPSIHSSPAQDAQKIRAFLETEWGKRYPPHTAFGEGNATERFVKTLSDPAFWQGGLQKEFVDAV